MENKEKQCPDCYGKGVSIISCCTGEVITDDFQMCPECHEHCGEDTCETCGGSGEVDEDEPGSDHVDMQLRAENYSDLKQGI